MVTSFSFDRGLDDVFRIRTGTEPRSLKQTQFITVVTQYRLGLYIKPLFCQILFLSQQTAKKRVRILSCAPVLTRKITENYDKNFAASVKSLAPIVVSKFVRTLPV